MKLKYKLPWFLAKPNFENYRKKNFCVIDIETTNLDKGDAKNPDNHFVFGVAYWSETDSLEYMYNMTDYYEVMCKCIYTKTYVVAHSLKFEMKWAIRTGVPVEELLTYDTMLAQHTLAGNRRWQLTLDAMGQDYCGIAKDRKVDALMKGGVCPSNMPVSWLRDRCITDVITTRDIMLLQIDKLIEEKQLHLVYTKSLYAVVLADIEYTGMHVDYAHVMEMYKQDSAEIQRIEHDLMLVTDGINMNSPKQIIEFLYEKLKCPVPRLPSGQPMLTDTGNISTDEAAMLAIRPRTKKQALFIKLKLEYQHLNKRITTYYKIYLDALENNNGIVHGKLNQAVAGTHRRTASAPNLQNQPRELKRCFNSRYDRWLFGQDDFKQLEYRAAGFMARCPVALNDIEQGVDAHTLTASMIYDGEVTKETRTDAKAHTFKPLYGGMSGSEKEKAYYYWFIEKHTGIKQWHKKLLNEVTIHGYVTTLTGMKFYFPHAGFDKNGYFQEQTKIKNYPVQYFATGEITPIGILHFWHILKAAKLQSFLVGEVHDSALSEIHPDETELVAQAAKEGMECWTLKYLDKLYGICYDYHLEIEHEASEYWGT